MHPSCFPWSQIAHTRDCLGKQKDDEFVGVVAVPLRKCMQVVGEQRSKTREDPGRVASSKGRKLMRSQITSTMEEYDNCSDIFVKGDGKMQAQQRET